MPTKWLKLAPRIKFHPLVPIHKTSIPMLYKEIYSLRYLPLGKVLKVKNDRCVEENTIGKAEGGHFPSYSYCVVANRGDDGEGSVFMIYHQIIYLAKW